MRASNRPRIAFLLSLATFFGGHYYNGRWAKALLFAALLPVVVVVAGGFACLGIEFLEEKKLLYLDGVIEIIGPLNVFLGTVTVAVAVVWWMSAMIAAADARRADENEPDESPLVRSLASMAVCCIAPLTIAAISLIWREYLEMAQPVRQFGAAPSWYESVLMRVPGLSFPDIYPVRPQSAYRGSTGVGWSRFGWNANRQLAAGTGIIRGKVLANGKPLAGLSLQLRMAPDLKSEMVASDNQGYYTIHVPPGSYRAVGWDLDYRSASMVLADMIETEQLPRSNGRPFSGSIVLTVEADKVTTGITLEFIDAVNRVKPIDGIHVDRDVVFEWKPYPGAAYYMVHIGDLGTNPFGNWEFGSRWSNRKRVEGTTTTANVVGYRLDPGHYYRWSVAAYDSSRNRISTSGGSWGDFKVE